MNNSLAQFDFFQQRVRFIEGERLVSTILEPGIYFLIARSNSPRAIPFQRWLFEKVLPSIRKTGKFELENKTKALILIKQ